MELITGKIIKHRKLIFILFIFITLLSAFLIIGVKVNYNLVDYLPKDAPSTLAYETMNDEFIQAVPNARVCVFDVTILEALQYKERFESIDGITDIIWLDDIIDLKKPIEMTDPAIVEAYYKENNAVFSIAVKEEDGVRVINEIRTIIKENGAIAGDAVDTVSAQELAVSEIVKITIILVPIILIILFLSTYSWIEPFLYLVTIGVAVIINMGTNLIFGEISFITNAVSPILQLAVSLDYAIFLMNSFYKFSSEGDDSVIAMEKAVKRSFSTVLASGVTTIFGFMALIIMRFGIGSNLGIVLAKGVLLSLLSVLVFLPTLTIFSYKLLERYKHRYMIPSFHKISRVITKLRIPTMILIMVIVIPCFLAQKENSFTYGMGNQEESTKSGRDSLRIAELFGLSTPIVILVPKGEAAKEAELSEKLDDIIGITSVVSYPNVVGTEIPIEFLEDGVISQFYSENYCRIIAYADTVSEGEDAFRVVQEVRDMAFRYYGEEALTCGISVNLYDMRDVITADSRVVNFLAILAIGFVLLISFKSISLPVILVLTIETSIWINLSFPYFENSTICYIGFLVISTVQLGATVDYAILMTDHYLAERKLMRPKKAILKTLQDTMGSILISASILTAAGYTISFVSSISIVSQLGLLLGRGALLSALMVYFFLPAALTLLDVVISKSTKGAGFLKKNMLEPVNSSIEEVDLDED